MANDEREEEREFLAGLKARTGRDLAEWMAAIAVQGYSDKNEIIDWLRSQGLPFARASWLERIHRNGGKPIHASAPPATPAVPAPAVAERPAEPLPASPPTQPAPRPEARPRPAPRPEAQQPAGKPAPEPAQRRAHSPPPVVEPAANTAALEKLVSAAKGYRPLYHFLESQIRQTIPGVGFAARGRYVSVGAPREFAAVTLHPTEVRLGLDLGDRPFDAQVQQAKLRGPGPAIGHMLVLTDARQVNDELLALIKAANDRVNAAD